jgi:uncharacterized membrane protein
VSLLIAVTVLVVVVIWVAGMACDFLWFVDWLRAARKSPLALLAMGAFLAALLLALHAHFDTRSSGWTAFWTFVAGSAALMALVLPGFAAAKRGRRKGP